MNYATSDCSDASTDRCSPLFEAKVAESVASPALAARPSDTPGGAYEIKCLLDEATAIALEESLQRFMKMDPYAEAGGGQYSITTLSTDTQDFCTFRRQPGFADQKLRVRRYGTEPIVYLEQKTRKGNKVRKHRTAAELSDLQRLTTHSEEMWSGHWFQMKANRRLLLPMCVMTYERRAWFGQSENGPVRLTFDRNLRGMLTQSWLPDALCSGERNARVLDTFQLVSEGVICEFKFSAALPQVFKNAIQQFQLLPGGFSKYRYSLSRLTGMALPPTDAQEESGA